MTITELEAARAELQTMRNVAAVAAREMEESIRTIHELQSQALGEQMKILNASRALLAFAKQGEPKKPPVVIELRPGMTPRAGGMD